MKYLIFSDTHRSLLGVREVIKRCPHVDGAIFLGDHYDDSQIIASEYPELSVFAVAGTAIYRQNILHPRIRK